jgi:quercetin dioxygenase-like cupin family protein
MEKRVYENPLIKDKVTFLKTSRETNGAYTLVEVELAVGGGNGLHAHNSFSEEFIPLQGSLGVDVEKEKITIDPGQTAIAPIGSWHRFYNPGNTVIRFQVKLIPGSEGFENGLKIAYGLAGDGKTNKKGVPKSFTHIAVLTTLTDTILPGFLSLIQPILNRKGRKAMNNGIVKELINKYG